jgi:RsiW-degrading membrane proteinase PrsW (M82 family)
LDSSLLLIPAKIGLSLVPVFLFLTALMYLDSYKLVKLRSVLLTICCGCLAAGLSLVVNRGILTLASVDLTAYSRYGAPLVEETFKAAYLFYLLRQGKVGFMVDAAIQGFALGAGFALVENIYYLQSLNEANLLVWIIRGFGTAVMHGGTTAILGIVSKNFSDVKNSTSVVVFVPGFAIAVFIHSLFNHFILPPVSSTAIIVVSLPILMMAAFARSEKVTRDWLGVGFDNDAEILTMITTGNIAQTRIGKYLDSVESRFRGEVVADMLCYLRLYMELAIQAKGILMMRESGFNVDPDPNVKSKFDEMTYLEKSIGKTGRLALSPFLHSSSRDLWQMHMLQS